MCIIAYKTKETMFDLEMITEMIDSNPDGFGLATWKKMDDITVEKYCIEEGLSSIDLQAKYIYEMCKGKNAILHARIATSGNTTAVECHPFLIADEISKDEKFQSNADDKMLFHNGIVNSELPKNIQLQLKEYSDTQLLAQWMTDFSIPEIHLFLTQMGTYNRFILIHQNELKMFGKFVIIDGIHCSNDRFQLAKKYWGTSITGLDVYDDSAYTADDYRNEYYADKYGSYGMISNETYNDLDKDIDILYFFGLPSTVNEDFVDIYMDLTSDEQKEVRECLSYSERYALNDLMYDFVDVIEEDETMGEITMEEVELGTSTLGAFLNKHKMPNEINNDFIQAYRSLDYKDVKELHLLVDDTTMKAIQKLYTDILMDKYNKRDDKKVTQFEIIKYGLDEQITIEETTISRLQKEKEEKDAQDIKDEQERKDIEDAMDIIINEPESSDEEKKQSLYNRIFGGFGG